MPTLENIITQKKREGLTAIEVHKWLNDNNMGVPWLQVRKIFVKAK